MTSSIRTFLLINLLLSITLITSLAIIADIFLEHGDLRRHLDSQLRLITTTIDDFVKPDEIKEQGIVIQPSDDGRMQSKVRQKPYRVLQYQIWDDKDDLVLKPAHYENKFLAHSELGFSDKWINNELWRVFAIFNKEKNTKIILTERYNFRKSIEARITKDSIVIMLMTYPFLGLLIWIIVGRGLDTLRKLAFAVKRRDPRRLEPFHFFNVPVEIQPVVNELNHLFERLKRTFEQQRRFSSDAAHELRTPLAALRAQTQLALASQTEEDRKKSLKQLIAGVDRSSHVVEQLLTLSRVEGEMDAEFETVDLLAESREVVALLVPEAIKKDIDIELICEHEKMEMQGLPAAIGILIRNLVDNAIRYSDAGGAVRVNLAKVVEKAKTHLEFSVIDNGPGIPDELKERVFERFFRVLGTKEKGTGLGLGIVNQIAKLHHAEIKLGTPEGGRGLVFSVLFPIDDA